jgi:hypothetical protein
MPPESKCNKKKEKHQGPTAYMVVLLQGNKQENNKGYQRRPKKNFCTSGKTHKEKGFNATELLNQYGESNKAIPAW